MNMYDIEKIEDTVKVERYDITTAEMEKIAEAIKNILGIDYNADCTEVAVRFYVADGEFEVEQGNVEIRTLI